jgi:hypothetical protein
MLPASLAGGGQRGGRARGMLPGARSVFNVRMRKTAD